jgi:hypothetical protein
MRDDTKVVSNEMTPESQEMIKYFKLVNFELMNNVPSVERITNECQ